MNIPRILALGIVVGYLYKDCTVQMQFNKVAENGNNPINLVNTLIFPSNEMQNLGATD